MPRSSRSRALTVHVLAGPTHRTSRNKRKGTSWTAIVSIVEASSQNGTYRPQPANRLKQMAKHYPSGADWLDGVSDAAVKVQNFSEKIAKRYLSARKTGALLALQGSGTPPPNEDPEAKHHL